MKKKISLLLCIIIASLCFAGCSKSEEVSKENSEQLEAYAIGFVQMFVGMEDEQLDVFKDASDFTVDYYTMYSGIPASGEEFIGIINSWQAAEKECGEYVENGEFEIVATNDGFEVSTEAKFEKKEATILFVFDEKLNAKSMDISAKISMSEILTKAGLNTLLGMGTVFVVLVFLAFLISMMKYIPVVMELFENRGKNVVTENADDNIADNGNVENVEDDLELIAVITAAIAAQEGTTTDGFVVRSIRRRPSNNW